MKETTMNSTHRLQPELPAARAHGTPSKTLARLGRTLMLLGALAALGAATPGSAQIASEVAAISFTANKAPVVNAFAFDVYRHLWLYSNVAHANTAAYTYLGSPKGGISGDTGPSAVTYLSGKIQYQYTFVAGADGNLYVCWYNGKWQWANQGKPGVKVTGFPSALLYTDTAGVHIHCFIVGADNNLYDNNWTGRKWSWTNLGNGGALPEAPTCTTCVVRGVRHIHVFATTQSGDLYRCSMINGVWSWSNQGNPDAGAFFTPTLMAASTVSYVNQNSEFIYAFTVGSDGALYVNSFDGHAWSWTNQGSPGTGAQGTAQAVAYSDGAGLKLYCFVNGGGDLYVNYWNSGWHWANQGASQADPTCAVSFNVGGVRQIYAFAVGGTKGAVCNYWNGGQWDWIVFPTP